MALFGPAAIQAQTTNVIFSDTFDGSAQTGSAAPLAFVVNTANDTPVPSPGTGTLAGSSSVNGTTLGSLVLSQSGATSASAVNWDLDSSFSLGASSGTAFNFGPSIAGKKWILTFKAKTTGGTAVDKFYGAISQGTDIRGELNIKIGWQMGAGAATAAGQGIKLITNSPIAKVNWPDATTGSSGNTLHTYTLTVDETVSPPTFTAAVDGTGFLSPNTPFTAFTTADRYLVFNVFDRSNPLSNNGQVDDVTLSVVVPAPVGIHHFAVAATSPQIAGAAFDVTITAQDAGNAPVNDSSTTVTVTSPTGGSLMEFDWDSNGTYGDNSGTLVAGVKTIKARNKKAQTVTIVASAGAVTTTTPPSVTTTAGAFSKLQVLAPGETAAPGTGTGKTGSPSAQQSGVSFNVTVNAVDANWNPVTSTDAIAITSTDGTATLPANANLVAGTQTFAVTFNLGGSFTVTATDVDNGGITAGVSSAINVPQSIVWKGDGTANLWNASALNWTNLAGTAVAYGNGDLVAFDDSGSTTPAVDITGTVTPTSITVNSANNYTLGSTSGGLIGGATGITKSGNGTLTLSTANSFTGKLIINGGTVNVGALNNMGAAPASLLTDQVTLNGGTLNVTAGGLTTEANRGITIGASGGAIQTSAGTFTVAANRLYGSGTFTKKGGATLANGGGQGNFNGKYVIESGIVSIGAEDRLGPNPASFAADQLTINGGNLRVTFTGAIDDANRGITLGASGGAISGNASVNCTVAIPMTGVGDFQCGRGGTPGSTITLSAANDYSGNTLIEGGTLALASTGSINNTPRINVQAGTTFDVSAVSGYVLGSGQTLYGNGTNVGAITANGTIAPGQSIGTLIFKNTLTLAGTVVAEITSTNADLINAGANTINLGGTLVVTNIGGSPLVNGTNYNLLDGTLSGTFTSVTLPGGAGHWITTDLYVGGSITFTNANPAASNFNLGVSVGGSASAQVVGKHVTDADGDAVTITALSAPTNGTASIVGGTNITYTSTNSAASDSFTYTVSDSLGGSSTATITVQTYNPEGFNRLSPPSVIEAGTVTLSYLGIPGYNYALDWTTNLTPPIVWTALITNTAAGDGSLNFTNTSAEPVNFFRTRHVP